MREPTGLRPYGSLISSAVRLRSSSTDCCMQKVLKHSVPQLVRRQVIAVPQAVRVAWEGEQLIFEGPLGSSSLGLTKIDPTGSSALRLAADTRELEVASISKPFFGTLCSLIENKIYGVSEGYLRYLNIQGIGYRASLQGMSSCVLQG